eukprot:3471959-Pleurochrysis_carterae.AAC.1
MPPLHRALTLALPPSLPPRPLISHSLSRVLHLQLPLQLPMHTFFTRSKTPFSLAARVRSRVCAPRECGAQSLAGVAASLWWPSPWCECGSFASATVR